MKELFKILFMCYSIYVNENYTLLVCEIEESKPSQLIEVIEGDGYKENVTFEELNDSVYHLINGGTYGKRPCCG